MTLHWNVETEIRGPGDEGEEDSKGLFTWREEDPSTRKILEGETAFHLVYMQKIRSEWQARGEGKEEKLSAFRG